MVKSNQIIFMKGKEKALEKLFSGDNPVFGYVAIGYAEPESNGFEEPSQDSEATQAIETTGFKEIPSTISSYHRIKLQRTNEQTDFSESTGKVLVKFQATLETDNINVTQDINQIAVVDSQNPGDSTTIYSATTFPTFVKTGESSLTFILGFRL